MKTIIAGSRSITDIAILEKAIDNLSWKITEVVCGCARGVDTLGKEWAEKHNIPVAEFPAMWSQYGKSAGYRRNEQMAENAEALLAIWDGESRGTMHMINIAKSKGLQVYIERI